jgi:GTP-binding protein
MNILSAEFLTSAFEPAQFPRETRPEIAFVGRSNVGKSTLLNAILNRKDLAKTSKRPGKTQTVNFYDVNNMLHFVDLPGYGFAKVSHAKQAAWKRAITSYIMGRRSLRLAVHLIDARHPPTPRDHELLDLLDEAAVPTLIVATKVDKLKQSERATLSTRLRNHLGIDEAALVVPCSAVTGEGIREIWETVERQITTGNAGPGGAR